MLWQRPPQHHETPSYVDRCTFFCPSEPFFLTALLDATHGMMQTRLADTLSSHKCLGGNPRFWRLAEDAVTGAQQHHACMHAALSCNHILLHECNRCIPDSSHISLLPFKTATHSAARRSLIIVRPSSTSRSTSQAGVRFRDRT